MCDINYIWLFNLLAAVVLITLQQQQHVVGITQQHQQNQEQQLFQQQTSPYDGISSYAAAAAANYLHRSTLPHHMVKREIKNVKNTDFISYLNGKFFQQKILYLYFTIFINFRFIQLKTIKSLRYNGYIKFFYKWGNI